ncbi:MAG: efflux transporter outer membrane subunit [Alphaproteobacteria bacterium]|nr:efflux transporter outer membrane subunit [Alphaproteobacteria bacterium]
MRMKVLLTLSVSAAMLTACAEMTPVPRLMQGDVPAAFEQPVAPGAPIWPEPDWWRNFSSAELDSLIAATQAGNFDLAAAEARVLQADARIRQTGSILLPTVELSGDANQSRNSGGFGVSLGANYELDLWGKNRSTVAAAVASGKATRADRETIALTATTATATTYFQLLSLRERLAIARLNLQTAQEVLMVTEARVRNGIATPLELAQQRAQIAGQQSVIPGLEQQELETRAALATLLGRPPEGFQVSAQDAEMIALPAVAPGLPSELLIRRPDIVAAEAGLQAANANLVAARAAMLPSISLTASGGLASAALGALIANQVTSYSIGASLFQTIFDAGRLQAQSEEVRAREQEVLANYRNVTVIAFAEVETTLGAIANLTEQQVYQLEQEAQSEQAFNIATARYREGVSEYLTVLDAQRTLYSARDQLGLVKLARLQAIVALYKALGGGWEDPTATNLARQ